MSHAPASVEVLGLTSDELVTLASRRLARGAGLAPRLYAEAMRRGRFEPALAGASAEVAAGWQQSFRVAVPAVVASAAERATAEAAAGAAIEKVALAMLDGACVEAVRIPMGRGRESLCLSSQVGCRMGCRFCETGARGWRRDLLAAEIVGQVVAARQLGWAPRSLVFQGMGEPLDNLDQVLQALRVLTDRRGLAFSRDRITLCTVGRVAGLERLAALGWKRLNVAFSLTAANDELRRRLVPSHGGESLARLQAALQRLRRRPNFQLGIHYCLLPGWNDRPADAVEVARFCAPLGRTLVHVIPYNPGTTPLTHAPAAADVARFVDALRAAGVPARCRIPKGRSVMAACGQLGATAMPEPAPRLGSGR
ncbi:MAG: radical SAM protein [Planctomycetota bacterium]